MKKSSIKTLRMTLMVIGGFFLPVLFIGYINWDITYIATIGEWKKVDRFAFLVPSVALALLGGITAFYINEKDKR